MYDSDELRALAVAAQGRAMVEAIVEMSPETVLELLDEIERLRKDAERYRFLKLASAFGDWGVRGRIESNGSVFIGRITPEALDAAIDAARTQGGAA